jgi:hypothetical protein
LRSPTPTQDQGIVVGEVIGMVERGEEEEGYDENKEDGGWRMEDGG